MAVEARQLIGSLGSNLYQALKKQHPDLVAFAEGGGGGRLYEHLGQLVNEYEFRQGVKKSTEAEQARVNNSVASEIAASPQRDATISSQGEVPLPTLPFVMGGQTYDDAIRWNRFSPSQMAAPLPGAGLYRGLKF